MINAQLLVSAFKKAYTEVYASEPDMQYDSGLVHFAYQMFSAGVLAITKPELEAAMTKWLNAACTLVEENFESFLEDTSNE